MTGNALRRWCLARPSAVEEFPFGPETSVFKVGGKMFALAALAARPLTVSLKCEPSLAEALRAEHPAIQPGYHLNKRHWITVTLDNSLPDKLAFGLLEDSYELVVAGLPKRERDLIRACWPVQQPSSAIVTGTQKVQSRRTSARRCRSRR